MLRSAIIRTVYMGLMFLAGLVLGNIALPERFGTISFLILNASLLSIVTGFGSDSMILHMVSSKKWNTSLALQFTWRALLIQVVLFLILEGCSLLIWNQTLLSNENAEYFFIDAIYFAGLILVEKYMALLYSIQKSLVANILVAILGVIYLGALLLIYYFTKASFYTIIYFFAGQSFLQGMGLVFLFYRSNRNTGKGRLDKKEFAVALRFASIVMFTNIIQLLAYRVDFWLIKYYFSNYEVGVYAQANKFANLAWVVPNILAQLLIPKFILIEKNEIPRILRAGIYFNFIIILITLICANLFYSFYLNEEYKMGLNAFYLMLPGYFFWSAVIYFGAYFSWLGKFTYNFVGSFCCLILILIADVILIPRYGLNGAAIANSLTYTLVFFIYLCMLSSKFSFKWDELLLLKRNDFFKVIKFVNR